MAYNSIEKPGNVVITEAKLPVNNTFEYAFPAHSITSIEIKGKAVGEEIKKQ